MHAPRFSSAIRSLVLALVVVALPAAAWAAKGEQAAVDKVTALNKKALDAYAKEDYETARSLLKEALEVCASAGLDQHPITARTHVHFGVVAIVGYKQREVGIKQFKKALEIQPDIKLTKTLVTPELQDAFEEAVLAGNGGGGGGEPAAGGGDEGNAQAPAQQADDSGGESTTPPRRPSRPPPKKRRPADGDDDDKDKDKDDDSGSGQKGTFFIAFGVGSGAGIASGNGALDPNAHKLSSPGFAPAQAFQIAPEVGFFVTPELLLSAELRFQYVTGLNGKPGSVAGCGSDMFCSPSPYALAGFAKASYLMGSGSTHFAIGGQIGAGTIRHAVSFPDGTCKESATATKTEGCVDTLNGGPFLIGPTFAVFIELGSSVDLIIAVNTALGVPNFMFNFDGQLGLGFRI